MSLVWSVLKGAYSVQLDLLKNNKDLIPEIAEWYFHEWGYLAPNETVGELKANLETYLNDDKVPLIVLTKQNGELCGVAQIKYREMDIYPDKEHWLGGVYVKENYRGKGLASSIIKKALEYASDFGIQALYLQTIRLDGGLYARLGWESEAKIHYKNEDLLIMVNKQIRN